MAKKKKTVSQLKKKADANYVSQYAYRERNPEAVKETDRRRYWRDPEKKAEVVRAAHAKKRAALLERLGGAKCAHCAFEDTRALHVDHRNGGGRQHYQSFTSASKYYKYVYDNPEEFQVLCANCNFIKRIENRELRSRG